MARRILSSILLTLLFSPAFTQTGGDNVYEFLNLTSSGLVSSLGGSNVSLPDDNLNLAFHNPSLLSPSMRNNVALNYVNYFAGINYGMVLWSPASGSKGNLATGLTYLSYGSFTGSDASGNITGSFSASEYSFSVIWSFAIDSSFSAGINIKPVISHLEKYSSLGIAADLGLSYQSRDRLLSAGLVIRNTGYQITTYAGETRKEPPFEIMAGGSARLAHAPLRFSLTLTHLEKFDMTWDYTNDPSGIRPAGSTGGFGENLIRHVIVGAELFPHKNLCLSGGYNFQRRRELLTEAGTGGAGLSWGFGFNTSALRIEFGRASYHLAGSSNHFSLVVNPALLLRKIRE